MRFICRTRNPLRHGAGGGGRTLTSIAGDGILSSRGGWVREGTKWHKMALLATIVGSAFNLLVPLETDGVRSFEHRTSTILPVVPSGRPREE